MFMPYRVPVRGTLKEGSNQLVITFPSTFLKVYIYIYQMQYNVLMTSK